MTSASTRQPHPFSLIAAAILGRGSTWSKLANAAGWVALAGYAVYFTTAGAHAGDAHAYWAADPMNPYTTSVNEEDAYLYAPAFVQLIAPVQFLPFQAFFVVWTVINLGVLAWTIGPVLAVIVLLPGAFSPVWVNLWYGNIAILMAAALVLVFRWPAAWSFLILTKVTPGVGLAWFVARREWRYVALASAVTLGIVAISFLVAPDPWLKWGPYLADNSRRPEIFPLPPLWMRLVGATAIAGLGGLAGARWAVPLAAVLAQPVFWFTGFAMFIAWLGLLRHRRWLDRPAPDAQG